MQGTRLGPYDILQQLGAGGMGEVWLAQDSRLGRKVAIKVLPADFVADPERLARFEQEARAAAALNHPNIAAVFDVGTSSAAGATTRYIVQEYLSGQDLRALLARGPLPLTRVLRLGAEIADALAAAHRAGIVHRDVKPENVFVTEDGRAKVLDFGLAKLGSAVAGAHDLSQTPTRLQTQAGAIMGTAGYMAPEQVRGEPVDARADLFACGCLLYEMAAGSRTFSGANVHQVLDAILNAEPAPLANLVAGCPAELARIARKCLAKDPARRYQGAADLAVDLRSLTSDLEAGRVESPAASPPAGWRVAAIAPWAAAAAAALAALWLATRGAPLGPSRNAYLTLAPPPGIAVDELRASQVDLSISPDGRRIAFDSGGAGMFIYHLDRPGPPVAIENTRDARAPVFSPDGEWLAYFLGGVLYRLPLAGGNPERIAAIGHSVPAGRFWAADGRILYVPFWPQPIYQTTMEGEQSVLVPREGDSTGGLVRPWLLPDGRVLFSEWDRMFVVRTYDPFSTTYQTLFRNGHDARYVPTGHVVYAQDNRLFGRTLDLTSLQVGDPVQLLDEVSFAPGLGRANYAFSNSGDLAYLRGPSDLDKPLVRIDTATGARSRLPAPPRRYAEQVVIAPDGKRLVAGILDPAGGLEQWVVDLASGGLTPLAQGESWDSRPFWTHDSTTVGWLAEECQCVRAAAADGSTASRPVSERVGMSLFANGVNADGLAVATYFDDGVQGGLWSFRMDDPGSLQPLFTGGGFSSVAYPVFSPDGRFIAYQSSHGGASQIYVRPLPRGTPADSEWRISRDGGAEPRWLTDGRIAYEQRGRIMASHIDLGPPLRISEPEVLAEDVSREVWHISADGSFVVTLDKEAPPQLVLITNWFAELQRLIPR